MTLTSSDLAQRLGVSSETIRQWCIRQELKPYLSPAALPEGERQQRRFSAEDGAVLALVQALRADGVTFEEIGERLKQGQRGELPAIDEAGEPESAERVETTYALARRIGEMESTILALSETRQDLSARLAEKEAELKVARDKYEAAQTALQGAGELAGELRATKEERDRLAAQLAAIHDTMLDFLREAPQQVPQSAPQTPVESAPPNVGLSHTEPPKPKSWLDRILGR